MIPSEQAAEFRALADYIEARGPGLFNVGYHFRSVLAHLDPRSMTTSIAGSYALMKGCTPFILSTGIGTGMVLPPSGGPVQPVWIYALRGLGMNNSDLCYLCAEDAPWPTAQLAATELRRLAGLAEAGVRTFYPDGYDSVLPPL